MGLNEIYGGIDSKYSASTAAFRFGVISKVCGVCGTEDICTLNSDEYKLIAGHKMTETLERLLFLYGAGVIDFTVVTELSEIDNIAPVLAEAENYLIRQIQDYKEIRIEPDKFRQALVCSAKSRYYAGDNVLSFENVLTIAEIGNISIVDGFVKITDYDLMKTLLENNERFGYFYPGTGFGEERNDISNILNNPNVKDGKVESDDYPFMFDPRRIIYYDKVISQLYGNDFISHCIKYGISIDENLAEHYHRYLRKIKCGFTINCCHRKRRICGDTVNQFDYFTNINNDALKFDYTENIELKPSSAVSDEELTKMALDQFCMKKPVHNESILEVRNQGRITIYVISDGEFIPVDKDTFRNSLFDYEMIWGKIHDYAINHSIRAVNGNVEVPLELMELFDEHDRPYAERLIIEQYSRQTENKGGKVFSKLSDLISIAEEQAKKSASLKAQQAQTKADHIKKMNEMNAERGEGVVES